MARSLVIIGDGRGDVHIAATPDAAGLLGRLQRRYPRDLTVLHEERDAGVLAVKVHERLASHRLRGDWFELADAVEQVRRILAEVDDRHHNHTGSPSNSAYSNGCRHPSCADARATYMRICGARVAEAIELARRGDLEPAPDRAPALLADDGLDGCTKCRSFNRRTIACDDHRCAAMVQGRGPCRTARTDGSRYCHVHRCVVEDDGVRCPGRPRSTGNARATRAADLEPAVLTRLQSAYTGRTLRKEPHLVPAPPRELQDQVGLLVRF